MDKLEIEKNRLDLSYQRNLYLLNAALFIGIGAIITYLVSIITSPEKIYFFTILIVVASLITYVLYQKINQNLKNISNKLKNLS